MSDSDNQSLDERLRQIVQHAYAHAPATRGRFDAAGLKPADIRQVADLARLPVLPKDEAIALQQSDPPFGGLLAVPLSEVRHIFFSPGPLYEPDAGDDRSLLRMVQLVLQRSGFTAEDVVLNTLSYHLVPAGMLLDQVLVMMGCTVIPGGVGNSDLQLKIMADLNVTAYVGTPSFLLNLIQKAEAAGLDFKSQFQLRRAFVTAEPLPPSLRHTLTDTYGLTLGNGYGTAELGFLALNNGDGMAMQLLPEPIIQVVDPDTGEDIAPGAVGEVVVTNFNRAYPLLRYGTGDLAVNVDPRPGESTQAERAIILVGRRGEAVKVRGMFVHPNQLRFAMAQVNGVRAVQGVVRRLDGRDQFALKVVLVDDDIDQTAVAGQLQEAVRQVCRIRVDEVQFVPAGEITADAPGMLDQRQWE